MPDEPINEPGNTGEGDGGEPQGGEPQGGEPQGGEGQQDSLFAEVFPEEHREVFKEFKDANGFVHHYKELQGKVPQVPDKYDEIKDLDINDDNRESFEQLQKFSKDELGLTQAQFEKLTKAFVEHDTKLIQQLKESTDETWEKTLEAQEKESVEQLQSEWGNQYDTRIKRVQDFIKASSDAEFVEYLDETGLGNDPRMVKFVYKMSTHFEEDQFTTGKIENNEVARDATGAPMLKFPTMK